MNLSREKTPIRLALISRLALPALAILSISAGLIAGNIFKSNHHPTGAASANITVTNNDQLVELDQSNGELVVTRTSTVTIKDQLANGGYTLSAKLSQDTLPSSTVEISSSSSTTCPTVDPCALSTDNLEIYTLTDLDPLGVTEDTTEWVVSITIPADASLGDYLLDIEYSETPTTFVPLANGETMQDATSQRCAVTPQGTTVNLTDARDSKVYKVRRMKDGKCWMVENLAFQLNHTSAPAFNPAAALNPSTPANTRAQYAVNTGYNTAAGQTTYLYNWCAALGDTSASCAASISTTAFNTVINGVKDTSGDNINQPEAVGICPAPFRLPKGGLQAESSISSTTANEFAHLDIAIGGTGANRSPANTYDLFMGTAGISTNWSGVLGGNWAGVLSNRGSIGYFWTSTANSPGGSFYMGLFSSKMIYTAYGGNREHGYAVRCIL